LKEHLFVAGTVVPVLPRTDQRSNHTIATTPTGCRRAMLCAFGQGEMARLPAQGYSVDTGELK